MTDMATATATATKDHDHPSPGAFCHGNHLPCQQHHLAIFFSPAMTSATDTSHTAIPGTWVDSNLHYCHCQASTTAASNHQEDMNHLRQTIASLRHQAKQLEMTDLVVKKSIQIVAKKRRLAQHSSQWDWCDPLDEEEDDEEDDDDDEHDMDLFHSAYREGPNVPILENDASESDQSVDDNQDQDCDGDWEWVC